MVEPIKRKCIRPKKCILWIISNVKYDRVRKDLGSHYLDVTPAHENG